ncbi:hypothetical protein Aperf_G00000056288 [Anoplocephala perfoliata]
MPTASSQSQKGIARSLFLLVEATEERKLSPTRRQKHHFGWKMEPYALIPEHLKSSAALKQEQNQDSGTPPKPVKRRGRKPGLHSSIFQRNAANARERSRMRVLSTAFMELKSVLPWVPRDTKLSKLDTLKLASGYIAYLDHILNDSEGSSNLTPFSLPCTSIGNESLFRTILKGSVSKSRTNAFTPQTMSAVRWKSKVEYQGDEAHVTQSYPQTTNWPHSTRATSDLQEIPSAPTFLPLPNAIAYPVNQSSSSSASQIPEEARTTAISTFEATESLTYQPVPSFGAQNPSGAFTSYQSIPVKAAISTSHGTVNPQGFMAFYSYKSYLLNK